MDFGGLFLSALRLHRAAPTSPNATLLRSNSNVYNESQPKRPIIHLLFLKCFSQAICSGRQVSREFALNNLKEEVLHSPVTYLGGAADDFGELGGGSGGDLVGGEWVT